jgi:nucleoside-diphosphate-sugar epimerase
MPVIAQRADRVVSIGGTAYARQRLTRPLTEDAPRDTRTKLIARIQETEQDIFAEADRRGISITHIRYPYLYGPRQLAPREWSIIRRILDGRRTLPIVDGGLSREGRAYAVNAAHGVLLAVDHPEAAGRIYHIADETTPTDAERARAIAAVMGAELELVNYPRELPAAGSFWFAARTLGASDAEYPVTDHTELDLTSARQHLGYADAVGFDEAIRVTVEWYLDHPLPNGGADEQRLGDPFDYDGEDRHHGALLRFRAALANVPIRSTAVRHAYDHPAPRISDVIAEEPS